MEAEEKTTENPEVSGNYTPERDEKGRIMPGHSLNPAGRPKGTLSITSMIKAKLQEIPAGQQESYAELLIKRILKEAIDKGDARMVKQIWNYIDGMPNQKLTIDSEQYQKVQSTLDQINELTQHEPQANTNDVSGGGETTDSPAEVPPAV